jgi:hypothetical protein
MLSQASEPPSLHPNLCLRTNLCVCACDVLHADRPHGWVEGLHIQPHQLPAARDEGEEARGEAGRRCYDSCFFAPVSTRTYVWNFHISN